jgi:pimeloyl-ACP methyl ester carboxylesterase
MNVLFLRGLTRETRHWRGLPEKYQAKYPEHKVTSIDLPGAGEFYHMTSPANLDEYVEFLRAECKRRNLGGKLGLIGISMGGMIALRWGELYPDEVEKIYVINTSARNLSSAAERFNLKELKTLFKIFTTKDLYQKEEMTLKLTTEEFKITSDVVNDFVSIQKNSPVSKRSGINQLWAASRFKITSAPSVPVIVVSGLKDRLVAASCSKKLAELIKAPLITHPTAGHDLPLDAPDWLLSELRL